MAGESDGVVEAGRAIRPYLEGLIGRSAARPLDAEIAEAFAAGVDPTVLAARLRLLLEADDETAWFLARVLRDAPEYRPPYVQRRDVRRGLGQASPAGDPSPVAADRYVCPDGDFVWYRPDIGTPIRGCSTIGHTRPLVRG